jgi:hypothetical protein
MTSTCRQFSQQIEAFNIASGLITAIVNCFCTGDEQRISSKSYAVGVYKVRPE